MQYVEAPVPTPKKGEVLVKVEASSVNIVDWRIQDGLLKYILPRKFPHIPGISLSSPTQINQLFKLQHIQLVRKQPRTANFKLNTQRKLRLLQPFLTAGHSFPFSFLPNLTSEPTLYSGTDISGEVVSVGPGVVEFVPGDKIFSWIDLLV